MNVDDVRDLMAFFLTLPPVSTDRPRMNCRFHLPSGGRSACGSCCSSTAPRSKSTPPTTQTGIAAVTSSRRSAIARNAIRRETFSAPSGPRRASRAGRIRAGSGTSPISHRTISAAGRLATSRACYRPGYTPDLRFVGSSMAGVVTNTAELPDADRAAIATYIKSLPARPTPPPS